MPKHLKFLAHHALMGFGLAIAFVLVLLVFDIGKLHTLLATSDVKWMAAGLLTFFMGLTLASIQMGIAIMGLAHREEDEDDDGDGPGPNLSLPVLAPRRLQPVRIRKNR